MRNHLLIVLCLVLGILSGCSLSAPNTMLENILTTAEKPSFTYFYQKKETKTYYDGDVINMQMLQTWEDASTGSALHELVDSEDGTFYTVINKNLMTLYQEGKDFATVKRVPSLYFNELLTQKENTIAELEALRKTHKLKLVEEDSLAGEKTYHFQAIPREENQILGEQHLWISQVNWMTMKRRIEIDKKVIEEKVLEFDIDPKGKVNQFTIPSQDNHPIEFRYEPNYEEINIDLITAPIYFLQPNRMIELQQVTEILSPKKGFRLVYIRNGVDYLQLAAFEKKDPINKHVSKLQISDENLSILPIPNVGIEITFSDQMYDYELLYFDPFATRAEIQSLLNRLTVNKESEENS